ncbi:hypothetical protein TNCV_262941 [Trichonephila clavipes]|nr:hypothetical protein TNCV_262941 [Trichonephila clavipes]
MIVLILWPKKPKTCPPCTIITLADSVARSRLLTNSLKNPLIADLDSPRIITFPIAKLGTHHYKGIKIHPNEERFHAENKNCPEIQLLTPKHIFECPAFTQRVLN